MKKSLRIFALMALAISVLTVSAFADTGPKPKLTVKVENAPTGYYLDILAEGDWEQADNADFDGLQWSYSDEERAALDEGLLDDVRAAVPKGWHACTAQGFNGAPMWGDLVGEDIGDGTRIHEFGYVGVPDTYRILMMTTDGEVWVSEVYSRRVLQSSVTVDWAKKTVTVPPAWVGYLLQFAATLLPTLLIEGALLVLFGYRQKKSWVSFCAVNLITQGAFAAYVALRVLQNGSNAWYTLLVFFPMEVVIAVVEAVLYRRLLTEHSKGRAVGYALTANVCSALLGLWLMEPVWRFIVTIL